MTVGGWIEMGATLGVQGLEFYSGFDEDYPGLRAEALYVAGRTREALETIEKAKALGDRYEERNWWAEPHSLRGVFLAALVLRRHKLTLRLWTRSSVSMAFGRTAPCY